MSIYSKFLHLESGVARQVDLAQNIIESAGVNLKGSVSGVLTHQAASTTTSYTLTWPSAQGSAGSYLSNNGAGQLAWTPFPTSAPAISNTVKAGQSFSANTSYVVRWGMDALGEDATRVYAADYDATSYDEFWAFGIAFSPVGVAAGEDIHVYSFGVYTLASGDTPFDNAAIGNPVWLGAAGAITTTAPAGDNLADLKIGIVMGSDKIWISEQMMGVSGNTVPGGGGGGGGSVTFPITIAEGGTGQTTQQDAINALAGAVTAGYYLRGNGTNVTMSAIQASDIPTLNQNTTGTAANITASSNSTLTSLPNLSIDSSQISDKGAANGVASLDSNGKVPSSQLPSYVDDVVEYANLAAFPGTGETGKIYLALDTNKTYRWSGSVYVLLSASDVTSVNGDSGAVTVDAINELTGDGTTGPASGSESKVFTLATVNSNVGSFGDASHVATFTVDAKGRITAAGQAAIAISGSAVSGNISGNAANVTGVVAIANGGTGQTTQQAAINALAGAQTAGYYLRGNGTNVTMSAIQAADVPTLNQDTTGTAANITASSNSTLTSLPNLSLPGSQVTGNIAGNAANVTGTVAIANGGTGQTTAAAALVALAGSIYDEKLTVVSSGATGNQINGPVSAGTPVTLPNSGNYTAVAQLQVYLNGQLLFSGSGNDWQTSGAGPTYTALAFGDNLQVGDTIHFVKLRNA